VASAPEGMTILAVTPVNFEEIIERSQNTFKEPYTEEKLKQIRAEAREKNVVAFVAFQETGYFVKEEGVGLAIHDNLK
jgi:ethanolamine utilization cobalamin adenosyltransferase